MFFSPMLLHKTATPFDNDHYYSEPKMDGFRLIYSHIAGKKKLYTRHNTDVSNRFPELLDLDIPNGTILDGEVVLTDAAGKPDFEAVMSRFSSFKTEKVQQLSQLEPVSFVVFDVLVHSSEKVTHLPLYQRKELLDMLIPKNTPVLSKIMSIHSNGNALFNLIKEQDLDGIVLKRKDSVYEVGKRSHSWLKVINYQVANVLVKGYRKDVFGWLLAFEDGRYAGVMELGVPIEEKKKVYQMPIIDENEKFAFIDPLSCTIKYRNITKAGLLRLPSFVSMNS
ncbi:ATP-dependent DNA ligase [Neobacillus sp. PS2-9]|uniref:ATP-dependent DNA ligase n=1 Tax=Neobacillus sp. PS2-9 TaxID=3070676 RepID=UPI0027E0B05B|nr:ATP-dependent DNA ligase [Neobacillus sp. PS2-9]WML56659.1 ATP-dependent DNA ligase [Neobacillus sp. PS2-9]